MANYSFKSMPPVPDDKTFTGDNFYQLEPNTEVFAGVTGLTFIKCNLTNCDIPADAEKVSCLHIQLSLCTNKKPSLIDHGLDECDAECEHMTSKDVITIDSVVVDTVYEYEHTKVT